MSSLSLSLSLSTSLPPSLSLSPSLALPWLIYTDSYLLNARTWSNSKRIQRSESRSRRSCWRCLSRCRCCCSRRCLRSLLVFVVVFFIIGLKLICQLHDLTFNWLTPTTTRALALALWSPGMVRTIRFVSFRSIPFQAENSKSKPKRAPFADHTMLPLPLPLPLPFFVCAPLAACVCVCSVYASLGTARPGPVWGPLGRRSLPVDVHHHHRDDRDLIAAWQTSSLATSCPLNIVSFDLSKWGKQCVRHSLYVPTVSPSPLFPLSLSTSYWSSYTLTLYLRSVAYQFAICIFA